MVCLLLEPHSCSSSLHADREIEIQFRINIFGSLHSKCFFAHRWCTAPCFDGEREWYRPRWRWHFRANQAVKTPPRQASLDLCEDHQQRRGWRLWDRPSERAGPERLFVNVTVTRGGEVEVVSSWYRHGFPLVMLKEHQWRNNIYCIS